MMQKLRLNKTEGTKSLSWRKLRQGKTLLLVFGLLSFLLTNLQAQTPLYFKTGTGTAGNTIPLNTTSQKTQLLYAPGDFSTTPIAGAITKIYFRNSAAGASGTYTNFKVSFIQNNLTAFANTSYLTGLTVAHTAATQTVTANAVAGGWFEIPLSAPYFQYNPTQTLVIEIEYSAKTDGISTTTSTSTGNKRISGTSLTATTGTANTTWNDFGMEVLAPCTAPITAGTANASTTSLCPGTNFNLFLSGTTFGLNQTYQWETSPNGTTGWTPVGTASNNDFITTSQTAGTHFYRAIVTCGTQTATSLPVSVTSPALASGNYTIDNNSPASSTNFQSFTAALNRLNCGVSGPVTFTVAPTSGPYNEQIEITEIIGASATNTITFQGNGRTISADPVTGNRPVIRLNGADFVTINNLNIETTGTSTTAFGWGIHFINGADNNTISNNTITIGSLSTTESNSVGIVMVNSSTTITTTGGNPGNNNIISGNTIIGGYKGIQLNNLVTNPGNNQITGNMIRDFYAVGIEVNGANGTLIENNNISRPNRLVVGAFEGITLSGTAKSTVVSRNRIHTTHGAAPILTAVSYGIFSTANDAPAGSENIVKNNLIYNFTGTGNVFAINNTGSDGVYYYNNTINIDNPASTGVARGFYQTTLATNIKFINNNVVVSNGGVATNQHAIFLNTATSTVESNKNNLYVPNGNTGFYSATQYVTLADWQTANSGIYDLASVAVDPFFVSVATGNLRPTNGVLNNVAQPLTAVTDDFTGAVRGTLPDIGAYEFTPSSLDLGVTALVAPVAKSCYNNAEPVTVTIQNFGSSAIDFSTITANVTVTVTGAATPPALVVPLTNALNGGQPLAAGATMNVTVGTLNMTTAGTYTFNATTAVTAGGTDGNAANNAMTATDVVVSPLAAGTASASNAQICQSGVTTLILNGNTGGNVQWQVGTSATGPFTNIAGATSNAFTLTSPISATTFYQAVISCGTISATSNVVTVTVNNPAAPTIAPVSRCGAGPVTLNASASTGTVNWYNQPLGGTAIATGNTFSPTVMQTTTYYAAAEVLGNPQQIGRTRLSTTGATNLNTGIIFTVNSITRIDSVKIYPIGTGAGTVKIVLKNAAGQRLDSVTINATGTTAPGIRTNVPLGFVVQPGVGYKLAVDSYTGGVTSLTRETSGSAFPYATSQNELVLTGSQLTTGTPSATTYYFFYEWSVRPACQSARTAVVATVNSPAATPTVTAGGATTLCTGGSVTLTAASATTGATYQWFLNGTAITGATSATYTANTAGAYTVEATANGCPSAASTATAVTVNAAAATPTVTAGGATTFCQGGSVALTAASATTGATFQWFLNGTAIPTATTATITAPAPGSYTVVATAAGCPSAASTATTVTVNATPATPTISQNGGILTSSSATGNQWFLNGTPIAGATGQTYVTTTNGAYTLQVTANGCPSALSAVTNVTTSGMTDNLAGMSVQVYPNPASGSFNVKLNGYQKEATVVLYNLAGQLIATDKVAADGKAKNIDIKGLAAGTYMLKVTSDKGVQVTRLVVQ